MMATVDTKGRSTQAEAEWLCRKVQYSSAHLSKYNITVVVDPRGGGGQVGQCFLNLAWSISLHNHIDQQWWWH